MSGAVDVGKDMVEGMKMLGRGVRTEAREFRDSIGEVGTSSHPLGADPYLPRGLIESFLRVFKHFALKIPRGKVWVFFKKTLGVKIKKSPGGKFKKNPGGEFEISLGGLSWSFL